MKNSVIFDLDGTLLYTLGDLAHATNSALAEFSLPVHREEEYRYFVGDGAWNQILRALPPDTGPELAQMVYRRYLEIYSADSTGRTHPYPGIVQLLERLKSRGVLLAVASNKPDALTQKIIARFFPGVFGAVIGKREGMPLKPDPAIVHAVLDMLGAERSGAYYVGDTATDVLTAKNAGLPCAGVLWGFRTEKELREAGADALCRDADELYGAIMSNYSKSE